MRFDGIARAMSARTQDMFLKAFVTDVSRGHAKEYEDGDDCPICYEPMGAADQENPPVKLEPCGHVLHQGCANDALDYDRRCPVCRTEVAGTATLGGAAIAPPPPAEQLLEAVRGTNVRRVQELLDAGTSANATVGRSTILVEAVKHSTVGIVKLLVQRGADVNKATTYADEETTPLIEAVRKHNDDMVETLVRLGANVNQASLYETPFGVALGLGHFDIAAFLLKQGAQVRVTEDELRGINMAEALGHVLHGVLDAVLAKLLLENGAQVSPESLEFVVAEIEDPTIAKLLLEHGAVATTDVLSHVAYASKNTELLELLVAHGAVITQSVFENAFESKVHPQNVWFMLGHGAIATEAALEAAVKMALEPDDSVAEDAGVVHTMLMHGAPPTAEILEMVATSERWEYWETVDPIILHYLIQHGAPVDDVIRALEERGEHRAVAALRRAQNLPSTSDDLLGEAIELESIWDVRRHLDAGTEATARQLDRAVNVDNIDIVDLLIERGATATRTHVDAAAYRGNLAMVETLLRRGAPASVTAFNHVYRYGRRDIMEVLAEHLLRDAVMVGRRDIVTMLLNRYGVHPTELHMFLAARAGQRDIVELLLDHDVPATDEAVIEAAERGHRNIVELLLNRNAPSSHTAVSLAAEAGHDDIADLLRQHLPRERRQTPRLNPWSAAAREAAQP